ncbi:ribokinase [Nocardioides albus]|uniref:Ribokinase n=1 Tax=Nocardioides albus TaxID=1841 RepID=A0A7W5A6K1_9ACTN|nr:ribokinase [Nocardioides albus]MBB3090632.1 ribokinase [Nocardioides albus]GGU25319.1 ribokinase [Nocardioides albus]
MSARHDRDPDGARRRGDVLVIGSISVDVSVSTPHLPKPGETVIGAGVEIGTGGKGANQAVAAARYGARTRIAGCVGDDAFAELALTELGESGVDVSEVLRRNGGTGLAQIRTDASGENDIVVAPLANALVTREQVDEVFSRVAGDTAVLLVQLEIPVDVALHAIRRAHDAGICVILDPAPAFPLPEEMWSSIDIVTPNETEAAAITGEPVDDAAGSEAAAEWFARKGARSSIITRAGGGATLLTDGVTIEYPPHQVRAVDSTAAGDAFAGVLAASIALGMPLPRAVEEAMLAGALTVTRRGALRSIPTKHTIDEFAADREVR